MAINQRSAVRPAAAKPVPAKPTPKPAPAAEPEFTEEQVVRHIFGTTVSRSLTLKIGDGEYAKFGVSETKATYEEASEAVNANMMTEAQATMEQANALRASADAVLSDDPVGDAEDGEPAALTADDVKAMKRPDLEALVAGNDALEIDPAEFPKTKAGLEAFKDAVILAAFGEGDEAPAEEAPAEDGEPDADGEELTEEAIRAMDRPALIALIKQYELAVDPKKLLKLAQLQDAVIAALTPADEAPADGEGEAYTEETLNELDLDGLKEIYAQWEISTAFPKGPPKVVKSLAVKRILQMQETGA